ncbi:prothymosin alpha-B isoform X1 [Corythoichthys intestinalis]|uniref:prothymosin alpha-B isoform X1 n=1 Tax=Corythoichthys intestinalis TaxID=161448 RepID=UPI0025A5C233|nr:prothymosin alpha-B isoform X1 [Corythoichthys intestinalis]
MPVCWRALLKVNPIPPNTSAPNGGGVCATLSFSCSACKSGYVQKSELKDKKLAEEKENGKDAATNGKENEENGEPEIDDEEDDEVDEEDEEDDVDGDEEDEEDDEDELEGGTKRAAEDDEDDDEDDVETKKQKTDDDD